METPHDVKAFLRQHEGLFETLENGKVCAVGMSSCHVKMNVLTMLCVLKEIHNLLLLRRFVAPLLATSFHRDWTP
jgi:hypothetical protein